MVTVFRCRVSESCVGVVCRRRVSAPCVGAVCRRRVSAPWYKGRRRVFRPQNNQDTPVKTKKHQTFRISRTMLTHRFRQLDVMEQVKPLLKSVSTDFSVPSIVVVGAQSSGKSSVLEHATGLAFPRGEGMCTRVPTVVSVEGGVTEPSLCISKNPNYDDPIDPPVEYGDTVAFGKAITELTDQLTKKGEIGETPIYVKLKKPNSPTFTLTDVPGITLNSNIVADDVIERQTTNLTRKMIGESPDTLVLLVLPATDDFGNSKALQLARKLDPQGERTIGVVTKIDNLSAGSDIVKKMSGDEIPLRHGFFAVRNRTQIEIEEELDIEELGELEQTLFREDAILSKLPQEQQGMPRLLEKVAIEQSKRLDKCIPELREKVKGRLVAEQAALSDLPESLGDELERQRFSYRVLGRIESDFRRCVKSDTSVLGCDCTVTNLSARVNEIMNNMETAMRKDQRDFLDEKTFVELYDGAKEANGYHLSNFMQGDLFRSTFSRATTPVLENSSRLAVHLTHGSVRDCFDALVDHHVGEGVLPALSDGLKELFHDALESVVRDSRGLIERLKNAEKNVTFTTNHYYAQTIAKFKEIYSCNSQQWKGAPEPGYHFDPDGVTDGEADGIPKEFMVRVAKNFRHNSNDAEAITTMQVSLHAYAKVVQKRFSDSVAAILFNEVVFGAVQILTDESMQWSTLLLDKVKEDPNIAQRRNKIKGNIFALSTALDLLKRL